MPADGRQRAPDPKQRAWRRSVLPMITAALLASTSLAATGSTSIAYRWQPVTIGGGGFVTGLVLHPTEHGLAYARTDIGGAYRRDAQARAWVPLLDDTSYADRNLMGIESIALDASDADRVCLAAGTYTGARAGNGAILCSHDRGATFVRTTLPFKLGANEQGRGNGERLAIDPNHAVRLWFGSRRDGLWRSDDGGAQWSQVTAFPATAGTEATAAAAGNAMQRVGIVFVVPDPASGWRGTPSRTIYAGISIRDGGLQRSVDGGASWQAIAGQPAGLRPNHMRRDARGRLLVSYGDEAGPNHMGNGAVWRFDPRDGSWSDITPAAQSTDTQGDGFGWGAVSVDASNPEHLLASTFNRFAPGDEVFRSVDDGLTWTSLLAQSHFEHNAWTAESTPHWISDVEIDPRDPERALFTTGYGLWQTRNLGAIDRGETIAWRFDVDGIEETVPLALISPPVGAHLLSGVGDIDGFRHDDLRRAAPRFRGPRFSNTESLAFAGQSPRRMVRSAHFHDRPAGAVRAAWSDDGGRQWTAFTSEPPEGEGAGRITLAADGVRVIWQPRNGGHWTTADKGARWQRVKGLSRTAVVEADRVAAARFYGFDAASGTLSLSDDGGLAFAKAVGETGALGAGFRAEIRALPERAGEIYIAAGWRGLLHWSKTQGLRRIPGIDHVQSIGLGPVAQPGGPPVLFAYGDVAGRTALYRSDDDGRRWQRIDDDAHAFGGLRHVTGDPRVPGRVYVGTEGRGIWYGEPR